MEKPVVDAPTGALVEAMMRLAVTRGHACGLGARWTRFLFPSLIALSLPMCIPGTAREAAPDISSPRTDGSPEGHHSNSPPSPSPSTVPVDLMAVHPEFVLVGYIQHAIALAYRPGDTGLYVAQRTGEVRRIDGGTVEPIPVLDLSGEVSEAGGPLGLLGMAFAPDGEKLYVCYTDRQLRIRLVEYGFGDGSLDPGSRRDILSLAMAKPGENTGGNIVFGPDGNLWLGLGDGNFKDTLDNAQSLGSLFGKLLRIDPSPSDSAPYTIPADNPFIDVPSARPEIYAYGLRHPWRFSFDRVTGDLWVGDVGQHVSEEIDFLPDADPAGANFGWNRLEGTEPYAGKPPRGATPPLMEYPHDGGRCAVIGGYVYRGTAIEGLQGAYLYADWCDGQLRALLQRDGQVLRHADLGIRLGTLASFGEGPDGELYALSQFGGVHLLVP